MKINEIITPGQPQKHFVGTCQNSFDLDSGDRLIPELPWSDVSAFAVAEENAIPLSEADFKQVADVPEGFGQSLRRHRLSYLRSADSAVYMIYDHKTDLHYFFV